jgi:hypothetical protein
MLLECQYFIWLNEFKLYVVVNIEIYLCYVAFIRLYITLGPHQIIVYFHVSISKTCTSETCLISARCFEIVGIYRTKDFSIILLTFFLTWLFLTIISVTFTDMW